MSIFFLFQILLQNCYSTCLIQILVCFKYCKMYNFHHQENNKLQSHQQLSVTCFIQA